MKEKDDLEWGDIRSKKMNKLMFDLKRGNYRVYLQPKIDLANDGMNGAEVLIRYKLHNEVIFPDEFIPELEYFEIIHLLDLYVFEYACYCLHKWKKSKYKMITLACNLSKYTLQQKDLVVKLNDIRKRYKIDASYLELEITETVHAKDILFYVAIGEKLKSSGYKLTLDDFGSGYSDFVFLSRLPFTCIKFDKDVTKEICKGNRMSTLFKNIIKSSHEIGIEVVAEGVESSFQKDLLKDMHCDYIQGYLIEKPIPVDDFESIYIRQ